MSPKTTRLGEVVRAAREKRGWTQEYAASRIGISGAYWSMIERGRAPRNQVLKRLAELLKIPLTELIELQDLPSPPPPADPGAGFEGLTERERAILQGILELLRGRG